MHACVCVRARACVSVCAYMMCAYVWVSEDNFRESVLYFYYGIEGSDSDVWVSWQLLLPAELSHWPPFFFDLKKNQELSNILEIIIFNLQFYVWGCFHACMPATCICAVPLEYQRVLKPLQLELQLLLCAGNQIQNLWKSRQGF